MTNPYTTFDNSSVEAAAERIGGVMAGIMNDLSVRSEPAP